MGKVSQYNQGELASSMTGSTSAGTAGIDTSGAELFKSIRTNADQITQGLKSVAYQEYYHEQALLRQKLAEQRAREKEMQNLAEDIETNKWVSGFDVQSGSYKNSIEEKYYNDTNGAVDEAKTQISDLGASTLEQITNPRVRAKVEKALVTKQGAFVNQIQTFANNRRLPIMTANLATVQSDFINSLGQLSDTQSPEGLAALESRIAEYKNANANTYAAVFGGKAKAQMDADVSSAAENILRKVAVDDPSALDAVAQTRVIRDNIQAKDLEPIMNKVRAIAAQETHQREMDEKTRQTESMGAALTEYYATPEAHRDPATVINSSAWKDFSPAQKAAFQKQATAQVQKNANAAQDKVVLNTANGLYQNYTSAVANAAEWMKRAKMPQASATDRATAKERYIQAKNFEAQLYQQLHGLKDVVKSDAAKDELDVVLGRINNTSTKMSAKVSRSPQAIKFDADMAAFKKRLGPPPDLTGHSAQYKKAFMTYYDFHTSTYAQNVMRQGGDVTRINAGDARKTIMMYTQRQMQKVNPR